MKSNKTIKLLSPLTLEECYQRLDADVDKPALIPGLSSKQVVGKISNDSIRLSRVHWLLKTYGRLELAASLKETKEGVEIWGDFGFSVPLKKFMFCYFSFLVLIGGIFWIMLLDELIEGTMLKVDDWMFGFIPIFLIIVQIVGLKFMKFFSRNDASFLTDYLTRLLNAKAID